MDYQDSVLALFSGANSLSERVSAYQRQETDSSDSRSESYGLPKPHLFGSLSSKPTYQDLAE